MTKFEPLLSVLCNMSPTGKLQIVVTFSRKINMKNIFYVDKDYLQEMSNCKTNDEEEKGEK